METKRCTSLSLLKVKSNCKCIAPSWQTLNVQECYFMCTGENCLSSRFIFIFMKSLYIPVVIRVKDSKEKVQVTKAFHGPCLHQAISPKLEWIIQHDGAEIKLWYQRCIWFSMEGMGVLKKQTKKKTPLSHYDAILFLPVQILC